MKTRRTADDQANSVGRNDLFTQKVSTKSRCDDNQHEQRTSRNQTSQERRRTKRETETSAPNRRSELLPTQTDKKLQHQRGRAAVYARLYSSGARGGGAENAGVKNAGVENAGVDRTDGKCRSGKYRSDNVWNAVKQKIKILNIFN